ncbi:hypothetical protein BH18ACT2_BH18ACT2_17640 [soil metagenome]
MRTRTLLVLAVGCGLIILVAGVVQLLRLAGQEDSVRAVAVGVPATIGDLTITVEGFEEDAGQALVVLELGGIDDGDGADDFRLVVPGSSLPSTAIADAELPACVATTIEAQRCVLTFDVNAVDGSSRVLLYRRGDERVRWDLVATGS